MKTRILPLLAMTTLAFGQKSFAKTEPSATTQALQSAEITMLKQKIKELTDSLQALKQGQTEAQKKIDSISTDLTVTKTAVGTAQTTANNAVNAAAGAQATANTANANTSNPVLMVGAESGRGWANCPAGYHWIGGFNHDTTVAYPELNTWRANYSWLCARN